MQAQFVTAIGAYLGTFLGIGINYLASSSLNDSGLLEQTIGICGTNVQIGDLTLPFTAGKILLPLMKMSCLQY